MELYSKRNDLRLNRRAFIYRDRDKDADIFLTDSVRNRLIHQIRYICKSDKYLERFLLVHDKNKEEFYLYDKPLKDLTLTEVGYDISEFINFENFDFRKAKYHDTKFFDLIEIILIFAKKDKRSEILERLNKIFKEENTTFAVHGFMVVNTENTGLRSVAPLIKEKLLKKKIYDFYSQQRIIEPSYELLAKTSAEIIQLIFSSPRSKDGTKKFSEKLCLEISKKWSSGENIKKLALLLSETVKNAKELSNQISDVRHTDRSTIPVDTPNIYKLIAMKNINLAELAILSLPESFVIEQNPEDLKNCYLKEYDLDSKTPWVIEKKPDIADDDIPF